MKRDVLIIGGGAIGLHVAYFLLRSGRRVANFDQGTIGTGSSSGNAGQIVPSHIVPLAAQGIISTALQWLLDPYNSPFGLTLSLRPSYLHWLIRFALSCSQDNVRRALPALKWLGVLSADLFAQVIAQEGFECHYRQNGVLFLYQTEDAWKGGQHEAELLRQHNLAAEVLSAEQVREREPLVRPQVIGGVHFLTDASLHPGRYLQALRQRVHELGSELFEHLPVKKLEADHGRIRRVRTERGDFEAEAVVLATGAWAPRLARDLGLTLPIQPARGYSMTMTAPTTMPRQALLLGERRVAVTPMGDLLRFTGRLELGNMSLQPDPRWLQAIERAVREYIYLDEHLDVRETWAGLRPVTPDGVPLIGFAPGYSNLVIATGHAMLGLSLGPGTGKLVADLLNGTLPDVDLRPFSVDFRERRRV